jgi:hypothetical protein
MKKPFIYAAGAAGYIALFVLAGNAIVPILPQKSLLIPMVMLSLFVLSTAIMGFLFLSEPFRLYMEGQKQEAFAFFGKIVGYFAGFAVLFVILLLFIS